MFDQRSCGKCCTCEVCISGGVDDLINREVSEGKGNGVNLLAELSRVNLALDFRGCFVVVKANNNRVVK